MTFKKILAVLSVISLLFTFCSCKKVEGDIDVSSIASESSATTEQSTTQDENEERFYSQLVESTKESQTMAISDETMPQASESKIEKGKAESRTFNLGEKYTLEIMCRSEDEAIPVVITKDGDNIAYSASIAYEEGQITGRVLIKDSQTYFILPSMKCYIKYDGNDLDELPQISTEIFDSSNNKYKKSYSVKFEGKKYDVDEFETKIGEDGTIATIKYFFLNGELKRVESSIPDSEAAIIDITSYKDKPDRSMLEIPEDYSDMSSLLDEEQKDIELTGM